MCNATTSNFSSSVIRAKLQNQKGWGDAHEQHTEKGLYTLKSNQEQNRFISLRWVFKNRQKLQACVKTAHTHVKAILNFVAFIEK